MNKINLLSRLFFWYSKDIKTVPLALKNNYFLGIDGLRAISILIVVVGHLNFRWQIPWISQTFAGGQLGVFIFFVLSGFLITSLLLKEKISQGYISLSKFYLRRLFRIVPVAYLYLVIIFILNFIFNLKVDFLALVTAALFIRNFTFSGNGSWYVNHYWSLAVEEQFYIIFPSILKWSIRKYSWFILILIAVIIAFRYFSAHKIINSDKGFLPEYLDGGLEGILFGSIFSILVYQGILEISLFKKWHSVLNCSLITLIFLYQNNFYGLTLFKLIPSTLYNPIIYVLIGLLIINNIENRNSIFSRFLNFSLIKFIGVLSYSIYVWQQLFTVNIKFNSSSYLLPWYSFPLNIILLIIISILSYKFYEQPIRLFYKRISIEKNKEL